ncbi:MAG: 23S rRNA (cytosine(1962)-C(5))-methyltransferase RlmI, partial [Anaerolineales bacterium]
MSSARITLKEGRDRSLIRRHPWVFSGSVVKLEGEPSVGEDIDIFTADGEWIARAAYSPQSKIRARVWTWDQNEVIDEDFFARRIEVALGARASLQKDRTISAYREIYAESDNIPGLIIDRY